MGRPIHRVYGSALRVLIAWLLALQPMAAAYAAVAGPHAPLTRELCRGAPLSNISTPDRGIPAKPEHSPECCLACVPAPAAPPIAEAEIPAPDGFAGTLISATDIIFVAKAGLGPQSARAPPL